MKTKRIVCNVLLASMILSAMPVQAGDEGGFFNGLFNTVKTSTKGYFSDAVEDYKRKEIGKKVEETDEKASGWFLKADSTERLMTTGFLALGLMLGLSYMAKNYRKKSKEGFSILGCLLAALKPFGYKPDNKYAKEKQKEGVDSAGEVIDEVLAGDDSKEAKKASKADAPKAKTSEKKEAKKESKGGWLSSVWNFFTSDDESEEGASSKKEEKKSGESEGMKKQQEELDRYFACNLQKKEDAASAARA